VARPRAISRISRIGVNLSPCIGFRAQVQIERYFTGHDEPTRQNLLKVLDTGGRLCKHTHAKKGSSILEFTLATQFIM
jgi:hypothetical protein